jgi:hypothetical protein
MMRYTRTLASPVKPSSSRTLGEASRTRPQHGPLPVTMQCEVRPLFALTANTCVPGLTGRFIAHTYGDDVLMTGGKSAGMNQDATP